MGRRKKVLAPGEKPGPRVRHPKTERIRKPNRETICTDDLIERVKLLMAAGAPMTIACESLGVSYNTLAEWKKPHMRDIEPFASFVRACEQAKAAHAIGCITRITRAAKGGVWQADAWLLERRYPEHYGRPQAPPQNMDIAQALSGLSPGQVLDIALSNTAAKALPEEVGKSE